MSGKLSWSHYCELLTIADPDKYSFYEKKTINSDWSIRELKRQISTSLYRCANRRIALRRARPCGHPLCLLLSRPVRGVPTMPLISSVRRHTR
ncbi:MAG: DUF1016 N-terminal domain-containing protein [Oscillospiraceae bacterium]